VAIRAAALTAVRVASSSNTAPARSAATRARLTGLASSSSRVSAASSPLIAQAVTPTAKTSSMTGSRLAKNWLLR
jgi:hypothetical protein